MEALDTVWIVSDDPGVERRRRTVPINDWWRQAVQRELDAQGMDRKELAASVRESPSVVTRALHPPSHKKWMPIADVIMKISDLLSLPYPFRIAETEAVARGLAEQHRLLKRDVDLSKITPGVAGKTEESQTTSIVSEHASRTKAKAKRSRKQQRAEP
jgi:hypothetical protein